MVMGWERKIGLESRIIKYIIGDELAAARRGCEARRLARRCPWDAVHVLAAPPRAARQAVSRLWLGLAAAAAVSRLALGLSVSFYKLC